MMTSWTLHQSIGSWAARIGRTIRVAVVAQAPPSPPCQYLACPRTPSGLCRSSRDPHSAAEPPSSRQGTCPWPAFPGKRRSQPCAASWPSCTVTSAASCAPSTATSPSLHAATTHGRPVTVFPWERKPAPAAWCGRARPTPRSPAGRSSCHRWTPAHRVPSGPWSHHAQAPLRGWSQPMPVPPGFCSRRNGIPTSGELSGDRAGKGVPAWKYGSGNAPGHRWRTSHSPSSCCSSYQEERREEECFPKNTELQGP